MRMILEGWKAEVGETERAFLSIPGQLGVERVAKGCLEEVGVLWLDELSRVREDDKKLGVTEDVGVTCFPFLTGDP